eukprot:scaffold2536_cov169-Amphora_coffeaeformis.AAC.14
MDTKYPGMDWFQHRPFHPHASPPTRILLQLLDFNTIPFVTVCAEMHVSATWDCGAHATHKRAVEFVPSSSPLVHYPVPPKKGFWQCPQRLNAYLRRASFWNLLNHIGATALSLPPSQWIIHSDLLPAQFVNLIFQAIHCSSQVFQEWMITDRATFGALASRKQHT